MLGNPRLSRATLGTLMLSLLPFSACTPDLGSHLTGKPELADQPFPDINSVPFPADASQDRNWHTQPETQARIQDQGELNQKRAHLLAQSRALKAQVEKRLGRRPPPPSAQGPS